jgi:tetratricopeptide (TPR) repeat protein
VLAVLLFVPALFAAHPVPSPQAQRKDKGTLSIEDYHSGRERLEKVAKMEESLKTAEPKAAAKLENKIRKQLQSAAADFKSSVRNDPALYHSWSELGFALRKLGRFDESLEAYDKALSIEPNFGPAIEYRAEAYLGLNRIEEAKEAYTLLFYGDRGLADALFAAMKEWVSSRRENPNGFDAQQIDQFATWVEQREAVHRQIGALTTPSTVRSW